MRKYNKMLIVAQTKTNIMDAVNLQYQNNWLKLQTFYQGQIKSEIKKTIEMNSYSIKKLLLTKIDAINYMCILFIS